MRACNPPAPAAGVAGPSSVSARSLMRASPIPATAWRPCLGNAECVSPVPVIEGPGAK